MCKCLMIGIIFLLNLSLLIIYVDNQPKSSCGNEIPYKENIELDFNKLDLWNFQYTNNQKIILKSKCPTLTFNFYIFHQGNQVGFVENLSKKSSSATIIHDCKNKNFYKICGDGRILKNKNHIANWNGSYVLDNDNNILANIIKKSNQIKIYNFGLDNLILLGLAGKISLDKLDYCNKYFSDISIFLITFYVIIIIVIFLKCLIKYKDRKQLANFYSEVRLI